MLNNALRAQRKEDHLRLAEQSFKQHRHNDFDAIHLVRPTLPETCVDEQSLATALFGIPVAAPFFINAMTGGTEHATQINAQLAAVAERERIAFAFGSASIVGHEPEALAGFVRARELAPSVPVLVNVNPATPLDVVRTLIQELHPAALQVHINAVQELVMPEGDRDFRWSEGIERISAAVHEQWNIPVIAKEVGFGWDIASMRHALECGVDVIDVAGSGGTNFAQIERLRRAEQQSSSAASSAAVSAVDAENYTASNISADSEREADERAMSVDFSWLEDAGLSTVQSLLNAQQVASELVSDSASQEFMYFGSGGVRHPLDVMKCLVLGAQAVGVSGVMLHTVLEYGTDGLQELVRTWKHQLAGLVALYGMQSIADVSHVPYWLDPSLESYQRQILHSMS